MAELQGLDPVLRARGLSVHARRGPIIEGVDLELYAGEVLALVGPSGAGKSTLLRCFNRLHETARELTVRGSLELGADDLSELPVDTVRQRVGMVFQQPVLFPGTVLENVLFGVQRLGLPRAERPGRAEEALRAAALWEEVKDRLKEPARQLSVGQAQRLCLARALAGRPEILLLDEPTSSLDRQSRASIEACIEELAPRCPVVLVTHDLDQAARLAGRSACLLPVEGVGRLLECSKDLLIRPQDPAVVAFLQTKGS